MWLIIKELSFVYFLTFEIEHPGLKLCFDMSIKLGVDWITLAKEVVRKFTLNHNRYLLVFNPCTI
jgi:hypothetical protein